MVMTHKQRILAAAWKQPVDKLPFGARIDLWYNYHSGHNTLPEKYHEWSIADILRDQGAGIQLRLRNIWRTEYHNVEVVAHNDPPYTTTEYRTPVGTVTMKTIFTPEEGPSGHYEVELPFRSERDYPVIEYLLANTIIVPNFDDYYKMEEMLGDDGVIVTGLRYSPMQQIMRYWMGYESFFYELHDHPTKVERLYELVVKVSKKILDIVVDLPVEIFTVDGNWSDDVHTPVFKKYFVPWLRETVEFLHSKGKLSQVHADGEMKRLIPMFLETGADIAEAWSPVPMTSVTTAELKKAWGDKVTIWGGVPSMLFEPQYSDQEFDDYVMNLFKEVAPGHSFIVGMGDNLPFDGKIERVGRLVDLIEKYGHIPIEV